MGGGCGRFSQPMDSIVEITVAVQNLAEVLWSRPVVGKEGDGILLADRQLKKTTLSCVAMSCEHYKSAAGTKKTPRNRMIGIGKLGASSWTWRKRAAFGKERVVRWKGAGVHGGAHHLQPYREEGQGCGSGPSGRQSVNGHSDELTKHLAMKTRHVLRAEPLTYLGVFQ